MQQVFFPPFGAWTHDQASPIHDKPRALSDEAMSPASSRSSAEHWMRGREEGSSANSAIIATGHAYIARAMSPDSRHRRTRTRESSSTLAASTSSLTLATPPSLHKRTTSLGVPPYPYHTAHNDSALTGNSKRHRRAASNQPLDITRPRVVLGDSTTIQQNMPSLSLMRRSPLATERRDGLKVAHQSDEQTSWTDDRQRGLELLLGLMGGSDAAVEDGKPTVKNNTSNAPKSVRKNKSTDVTPLVRPTMHRSRHSLGPGIPLPFSALSRCSSPQQTSKTAKSTPAAKSGGKNRPPPLRDLPPPSWSCPGPSPPLTGLAQPFPSECWVIHVPSPINAVIAPAVSPPATPDRRRLGLQAVRGDMDFNCDIVHRSALRRRRSSLSSFESSTSTIRPPAWYANAINELTPRPSRNQLLHEAQHETFANLPIATPSQRKRRHDREARSDSVPFEGDDDRGRGRRRVRDGRGCAQRREEESQRGWTQTIGGWLA